MNVKIVIAFFAVVTLLQLSDCKPTHRFVRENVDENESRFSKIKEFLGQFYGSSSKPQSPSTPTNQPDSSTYNPESSSTSSSTYNPESSSSNVPVFSPNQPEVEAGPEPSYT